MRIASYLTVLLIATTFAVAGPPDKFSKIRAFVPNSDALTKIWDAGVDFEGTDGKVGGWMEFTVGPHERHELDARKIAYDVVVDDQARFLTEGLAPGPRDVLGFGLGSMGGYYTYAEIGQQLDTMRLLHPTLVSAKAVIGYSSQGREIWAVKISDNPDDEEGEPSALYTALHHAREPGGMMTVIYYMWWLLENHGTDARAAYLIDNRELWFIPVVNPDGYVYNQTTNPAGGGMWRKNRANNGDGTFGVDLNRNYGTFTMWNAPNGGSSTSTGSDTYRGSAPFSELETQAIDNFMRTHVIATALNFHTYGRYLIYPWGYLSGETEDSVTYREFGFDMVGKNRHTTGTDLQTVSYSTRGNSDDYMYGDDSKPRTFAMTPECGSTFWPASSQIFPIVQENFEMTMYCSYVAGAYPVLGRSSFADAQADGDLEPGESFTLSLRVRNKGLGATSGLSAAMMPIDPGVVVSGGPVTISALTGRADTTIQFAANVSPSAPVASAQRIVLILGSDDGYVHRDTLTLPIGHATVLFADDAESGLSNWTTGAGWGTSAVAHGGALSFTDSPSGKYANNANSALTLAAPVDLAGCDRATLQFWTKWAIEPTWDFGLVEVSTNGGGTWTALRASLSHGASGYGVQSAGLWGFDGYVPELTWVPQEIDLTPYVGGPLLLRFRLLSDAGDTRDGLYVDDIRIVGIRPSLQNATLSVTASGHGPAVVTFGESILATDGLDSLFDEIPRPIGAPPAFDAYFTDPDPNGTSVDMRPPLGPGRLSNVFHLVVQPLGVYPVTLRWDASELPAGGWHLRDQATGGVTFSANMLTDSTLTILGPAGNTQIEIVHTPYDTMNVTHAAGWQLVSLPMSIADASVATLYPGAISSAWGFWGTDYASADPLVRGRGYWLKFSSSGPVTFAGVPTVRDTIVVPAGWAIVPASAVVCAQDATALDCPGCGPFYTYNNGYTTLATLQPGAGAFVKGPRTIVYNCFDGPVALPKGRPEAPGNAFHAFSIADAAGGMMTLRFASPGTSADGLDRYELPPAPPAGLFDARFASGRSAEVLDAAGSEVTLRSVRTPVRISWPDLGSAFELETIVDGAPTAAQTMLSAGSVTINDARVRALRLRPAAATGTPSRFRLAQNYPNPFNPTTTIVYDLASRSVVTLRVVNALGQTVRTLVDRAELAPGTYRAVFDADGLPSGAYVASLVAAPLDAPGGAQLTTKMLLLR